MWVPVKEPEENSLGLKIIFVVFLLVLIGELTYFFYIVPNKKVATTIVPTFAPLTPTNIVKKENLTSTSQVNTKSCISYLSSNDPDILMLESSNYFLEKKSLINLLYQ